MAAVLQLLLGGADPPWFPGDTCPLRPSEKQAPGAHSHQAPSRNSDHRLGLRMDLMTGEF